MMKIKKGLKTSRKAHSCHVVWNSSSEVTTRRMEESCMQEKKLLSSTTHQTTVKTTKFLSWLIKQPVTVYRYFWMRIVFNDLSHIRKQNKIWSC